MTRARDLVDMYEELITRVKLLRVKSREEPEVIDKIVPRLEKAYSETMDFLNKYSEVEVDPSDRYGKYLKTYHDYLLLISIPYLLDLLIEINDNLDNVHEGLDKVIKLFKDLLNLEK